MEKNIRDNSIDFLFTILIVSMFFYLGLPEDNKKLLIELNVERDEGFLPMVEIELGGLKKKAIVDLGTKYVSLDHEIFERGIAIPTGIIKKFRTPFSNGEEETYLLNQISIDSHPFYTIECDPPRTSYLLNGIVGEKIHPSEEIRPSMLLGREIFKDLKIIFDLGKNKIYILGSKRLIEKTPFASYIWMDLGADFSSGEIEIPILFQNQQLLCLLDSGCNYNLFFDESNEEERKNGLYFEAIPKEETPNLLIGRSAGRFLRTNLKGISEGSAGYLGVLFMEKYVLYVDFEEERVFVLIPPDEAQT